MIPVTNLAVENLPSPVDRKAWVNAKSNPLKKKFKINMILGNLTLLTILVSTVSTKTLKLGKKFIKLKLRKYLLRKIKSAKLTRWKNDKSDTDITTYPNIKMSNNLTLRMPQIIYDFKTFLKYLLFPKEKVNLKKKLLSII